ncbi:restriction endonuclease [Serratia marcescens]|uniref:restriction endonuclease subunit S n=1 Tax=Serratia marcescens TaxID=615 RepID=UPI000CDDE937|nr:restriction endonuclease subunit S [Serratia marcescens]POW96077.1 restriction endonuclease [Serratia marcescens]POW98092.1 restriction endonuclease [Serratia marcescens]POX12270.1 restriction endonuclease [Serratia marcescens]
MSFKWEVKKLGDILTLQRGHDLPSQERKFGKVPIMGSSGITGYHDQYKAKGPGVIVGRSGNSMGQVSYVPEDYWPLNTSLYVTDFKGNCPEFIYYFLKQIDFDQFNSGSAQKSLNRNAVYPFEVKFPSSYKTQSAIASFLFSLEKKIEFNKKINQTLEQMAQALFKSWFVDFEPVKAKIAVLEAGGSQEDATLAAMMAISGKDADALVVFEREHPEQYAELKATADLFPSAMQDSELGEIPEGWSIGKLGDIIEFNPKRVLKKGNVASYLDMKNVPITGHSAQDIIDREFSSGSKFKNGDTLLARITPCLENGKTAYVDFLPTDEIVGWGSTEFIVMRSKKILPVSISYFFARLDSFRTIAIQSMQGTSGRQRADASVLEQHVWIVPPDEVLQKFGTSSDLILNGNRVRNTENKSLAQLRDTLLPKLLSGEITLPDTEQGAREAENV